MGGRSTERRVHASLLTCGFPNAQDSWGHSCLDLRVHRAFRASSNVEGRLEGSRFHIGLGVPFLQGFSHLAVASGAYYAMDLGGRKSDHLADA